MKGLRLIRDEVQAGAYALWTLTSYATGWCVGKTLKWVARRTLDRRTA